MHGPEILARTMSGCVELDKHFRNAWQYQPRSDRHSKAACWGILFDLVLTCRLLADHLREGRVGFGINHEMRDFRTNRKKRLDLVLCTPGTERPNRKRPLDFVGLAKSYALNLTPDEKSLLHELPPIRQEVVGEVLVALEAKACMTEHLKARPRLYDELSASHQTVHGSAVNAIAAGFVMVNLSEDFISPGRNRWSLKEKSAVATRHKQPGVTAAVIDKIREIPRRATTQEIGFDAVGVVVVRCRNDGSPVSIVHEPPAVEPGDVLHYDSMIRRMAKLYESRFPQA